MATRCASTRTDCGMVTKIGKIHIQILEAVQEDWQHPAHQEAQCVPRRAHQDHQTHLRLESNILRWIHIRAQLFN
jgi:hypothetical protein